MYSNLYLIRCSFDLLGACTRMPPNQQYCILLNRMYNCIENPNKVKWKKSQVYTSLINNASFFRPPLAKLHLNYFRYNPKFTDICCIRRQSSAKVSGLTIQGLGAKCADRYGTLVSEVSHFYLEDAFSMLIN